MSDEGDNGFNNYNYGNSIIEVYIFVVEEIDRLNKKLKPKSIQFDIEYERIHLRDCELFENYCGSIE